MTSYILGGILVWSEALKFSMRSSNSGGEGVGSRLVISKVSKFPLRSSHS